MNRFEYSITDVRDIVVNSVKDAKGKDVVKSVEVAGREVAPTGRFWSSLCSRFSFSPSIFKFYEYGEVFNRISEKSPKSKIRLCIDNGKSTPELLAVSNPAKSLIRHDILMDTLTDFKAEDIQTDNGMVTSTHVPRVGFDQSEINGDLFSNRFTMVTPIDGYGAPSIYLSLMRLVCSNGMVAMSRSFKSELTTGGQDSDAMFSIQRALDSFANDEGFACLRDRVAKAGKSWASMYEANKLHKLIRDICMSNGALIDGATIQPDSIVGNKMKVRNLINGDADQPETQHRATLAGNIQYAFRKLTGDMNSTYGVSNLDNIAEKRQRVFPINATVYELMNFATEVGTHYASGFHKNRVHAWVGDMFGSSDPFDLEGTKERYGDFREFMIDSRKDSSNFDELRVAQIMDGKI